MGRARGAILILGYSDIKEAIDSGRWKCHRDGKPIGTDKLTINSNSINVSIGNIVLCPKRPYFLIDLHNPKSLKWKSKEFRRLVMWPGRFCLTHARERIDCSAPLFIHGRDRYFAPMIEGRSTAGRCGISSHECAGFGDFGFGASFTYESTSRMPIVIRPGDEIAQVLFQEVSSPMPYQSVYSDQYDEPRAPVLGRDRFRRHP